MKRIIIWGTGRRTDRYMEFDYFEKCDIVAFFDTNKHGVPYYGYTVYEPSQITNFIHDVDYLIISTQDFSIPYCQCVEMRIDREKIILTDYVSEPLMMQNLDVIESVSPKLRRDVEMRIFSLVNQNEKDYFDEKRLVGKGKYVAADYIRDYFRYRTFEFVADEILERNVEGSVAELGVFRGVFSALINEKFKDRDFYLFDTLEGFEINEAKSEKEKGRSNEEFEYVHKKTSEEILLNNLPHKDKCHLCKGFFPSTITHEIERVNFAFVSIDVDFENSIYEGIKFFYPRLSENGVIFLHDYNSQDLLGVKAAVKRYEADFDTVIKAVPLADRAGTLVVVK